MGLFVAMAALVIVVLGLSQAALTSANTELEYRAMALPDATWQLQVQRVNASALKAARRQSPKMEAIGRIMGGLAHDFDNLPTVLRGNLELIDLIFDSSGIGLARLRYVDSARHANACRCPVDAPPPGLLAAGPLAARIVDANATIADFAPLVRQAIGHQVELRRRTQTVVQARSGAVRVRGAQSRDPREGCNAFRRDSDYSDSFGFNYKGGGRRLPGGRRDADRRARGSPRRADR